MAIAACFITTWQVPVALIGGLLLGLAGIRHLRTADPTREELVATWTDLLVGAAMAVFIAATLLRA